MMYLFTPGWPNPIQDRAGRWHNPQTGEFVDCCERYHFHTARAISTDELAAWTFRVGGRPPQVRTIQEHCKAGRIHSHPWLGRHRIPIFQAAWVAAAWTARDWSRSARLDVAQYALWQRGQDEPYLTWPALLMIARGVLDPELRNEPVSESADPRERDADRKGVLTLLAKEIQQGNRQAIDDLSFHVAGYCLYCSMYYGGRKNDD